MPDRVEDPWYDADHEVRRIRNAGEIKWQGELVFVSQALVGELIGIAELETGDHVVRFCELDIGLIDRRSGSAGSLHAVMVVRLALPTRATFHLRVGLAREFGNPGKCYAMVNGVL